MRLQNKSSSSFFVVAVRSPTTNGFTNELSHQKSLCSLLRSPLKIRVLVLSILTRRTELSLTFLSNFSSLECYVPFHFYETDFKLLPHRSCVRRWYFHLVGGSCFFFFHSALSHPQNSSAELSSALVELYNSHIDWYLPKAYCNHFTTDRVIGSHTLTFPLDMINAILIFSDFVRFTTYPSITTE